MYCVYNFHYTQFLSEKLDVKAKFTLSVYFIDIQGVFSVEDLLTDVQCEIPLRHSRDINLIPSRIRSILPIEFRT